MWHVVVISAAWGAEGCPEVDVPPGLEVGAAEVTAALKVGTDGRVTAASDWTGPVGLVRAVEATLAGCRLAPGEVAWRWVFPEPPVNVAGVVRSRGDRAPLEGVTVAIGERSTRTDAQGRFELRNVAPGELVVRVVEPEWRLPETEVSLARGERVDLELWVTPGRVRENEVVGRYTRDQAAGVVRTVGVDEAKGVPGTLGDPLRGLTSQAGLTRAPYDAGWLLVRGGEFDEVGLFLDGVRVPLVYHLGGFTSVLHPEIVEAVQFWPGLFPARYGDAISGAVDMVPRPVGDRARVVGGVNLVFAHAFAEAPTRWGGIAVAARRSYLDGILALVLSPEAAGIAPRFWDVQARTTIGKSSITLLGMQDAIDAPSFSGDGVLTIRQAAAQAQGDVPIGRWLSVRPWVAWTARDLTGDGVPPQRVAELHPGLRVEARTTEDAPADANGGIEAERRSFQIERDGVYRETPLWVVGPYAGLSVGDDVQGWSEARGLVATWLATGADDPEVRTALSPRAGVSWEAVPWLELHAEFGRLHQLPTPTLLLAVAEGAYLGLERADQLAAGFRAASASVALDADVWTRAVEGLAEIETDGSIGASQGRAAGVESRLRLRRGGFDGSALYQYTVSQKREDLDEIWLPSPFEVPHRVELLAVASLPRAWTVSGRFRYTSGFPRRLGEFGLEPTEAYDILLQRTVVLDLPADRDRLAPFHALDLRAGRLFAFRKWQLEASLEVQNVYSRRVVEPVITGFGESQPSYGFGLPILPIFALDGKFWPGPPPP